MKKELMLMVLMFGILVGVSALISAALCVDTDGGKKYNTYGEIHNELDVLIYVDYCEGNNLNEMYCSNGFTPNLESYTCPNGCSDGACVSGGTSGVGPAEATATSVAKAGTRTSSTTGTKTGTSSKAKKSSGGCPASMTETTSAEGTACCIPKKSSKATGRFLGFMFRD